MVFCSKRSRNKQTDSPICVFAAHFFAICAYFVVRTKFCCVQNEESRLQKTLLSQKACILILYFSVVWGCRVEKCVCYCFLLRVILVRDKQTHRVAYFPFLPIFLAICAYFAVPTNFFRRVWSVEGRLQKTLLSQQACISILDRSMAYDFCLAFPNRLNL